MSFRMCAATAAGSPAAEMSGAMALRQAFAACAPSALPQCDAPAPTDETTSGVPGQAAPECMHAAPANVWSTARAHTSALLLKKCGAWLAQIAASRDMSWPMALEAFETDKRGNASKALAKRRHKGTTEELTNAHLPTVPYI